MPLNHIELHDLCVEEVFPFLLGPQVFRSFKFSIASLLNLGAFFLDLASGLCRQMVLEHTVVSAVLGNDLRERNDTLKQSLSYSLDQYFL